MQAEKSSTFPSIQTDETIKSAMKLEALAHTKVSRSRNTTQTMAFFLLLNSRHTATVSKQNILLAELGQNT
jgi:hypothetical protein